MSTTIPVSAKKEQSRDTWSDDRFLDRLMDVSSYGMATVTMLAVSYWYGFFLGALASGLQIAGQLGIFFILEPIARGHLAERQVRRLLARLNVPAVHDIFVRTPDGRQAQLDHVAFLGQAIAVIETKSITGVVTRTGSRWSHLVNGVERGLSGRSPQQQALNARDVLRDAYPSWRPTSVALTVLTHGELGTGFQGDAWVVKVQHLPMALARFQRDPTPMSQRAWTDLERFLRACRQTRRERWRFFRNTQLAPKGFSRQQLLGFGLMMGVCSISTFCLAGFLLQEVCVPALKILSAHHSVALVVQH